MYKQSWFEKVLLGALTAVVFLFFMIPLYWLLITSLKFGRDAFALPPQWLFFTPTLKNYAEALANSKSLMFIKNSLIITGGTQAEPKTLEIIRFKNVGELQAAIDKKTAVPK